MTHFHHSAVAKKAMRKLQLDAGVKKSRVKFPVQDVPTRWNSTFHMIDRLLELRAHVNTYLYNHKKREVQQLALEVSDWNLLSELKEILEPYNDVTVMIEGSKYPTLSTVTSLWNALLLTPQPDAQADPRVISIAGMLKKDAIDSWVGVQLVNANYFLNS